MKKMHSKQKHVINAQVFAKFYLTIDTFNIFYRINSILSAKLKKKAENRTQVNELEIQSQLHLHFFSFYFQINSVLIETITV